MYILLFLLFVVFCGRLTWEIAAFAAALALVVYAFMMRYQGLTLRKDLRALRALPNALAYALFLLKEIFAANAQVLKLIYSRKYEVEPALVTFDTRLSSELARAVLADSITLTPGTITAECEGSTLTVHCLDKEMAEGLCGSAFERKLARMEGKPV